ncbi:unnamed protein product [Moneuplotes crassus]|uniref:Uncharacterized protein n=1 Tax=Euplotes crassus TaxID=5936 RepID=A0AAD1XEL3_EUPCR|nr:unnamed protein product [Moneuplotes crassus]
MNSNSLRLHLHSQGTSVPNGLCLRGFYNPIMIESSYCKISQPTFSNFRYFQTQANCSRFSHKKPLESDSDIIWASFEAKIFFVFEYYNLLLKFIIC